ncbi:glutaredoxin 3 [Candidatus Blochmanniella floridana]|uniref:Glutaredoxin n=1 Tax=Blochmanniella floridana TaxID=203907 RepID=Q7VRK6_BLOFL|nr:glutaredoxin 3 [Candidatus Blochmannia floridanus]
MSYDIVIYTKKNCPYCDRAKFFLVEQSLIFKEIVLSDDKSDPAYLEMYNRSKGCVTVPQVFINNNHVGGSDDLLKLGRNRKDLEQLLK